MDVSGTNVRTETGHDEDLYAAALPSQRNVVEKGGERESASSIDGACPTIISAAGIHCRISYMAADPFPRPRSTELAPRATNSFVLEERRAKDRGRAEARNDALWYLVCSRHYHVRVRAASGRYRARPGSRKRKRLLWLRMGHRGVISRERLPKRTEAFGGVGGPLDIRGSMRESGVRLS
ncbi:hypothetical protein MRX96_053611 [Rhipicephalus microplus]